MMQGLATVIYYVPDLERAKAWYSRAFEQTPYFDQPFYVGFNLAGYELGLHPLGATHQSGSGGHVAYWRVSDIQTAVDHFVALDGAVVEAIQDVGEGIKVATVTDPFGNHIGLIENPKFQATA
jgi:predicted enzyme related to lactoylglutathione lyase